MSTTITWKRRFNKNFRCPCCLGCKDDPPGQNIRCWGFVSSDGEWAHCTNDSYAGSLEKNWKTNAYPHKLNGQCLCGKSHEYNGTPITDPPETLKSAPRRAASPPDYKEVARYPYRDERGNLLAWKVRKEGVDSTGVRSKTFTWIDSENRTGIKGLYIPPYRVEKLISSPESELVYIVEGEKSVHAIESQGGLAICSPWGSSGQWKVGKGGREWGVDGLYFARRHVILIPDKDEPGKRHMNNVAEIILPYALDIKVVDLPLTMPKSDVVDYFALGGTISDLRQLANHSPDWISSKSTSLQSWALARRRYKERQIA